VWVSIVAVAVGEIIQPSYAIGDCEGYPTPGWELLQLVGGFTAFFAGMPAFFVSLRSPRLLFIWTLALVSWIAVVKLIGPIHPGC
jgi:hypothetical protein